MRPALWRSAALSSDIVVAALEVWFGLVWFYSFTMALSYRVFGNPCEGAMHFRARTDSRGQCGLDRSNAPRFSWSRRLARPFWRWPRQGGPWIKAALRL